jgi:hypothetical protein
MKKLYTFAFLLLFLATNLSAQDPSNLIPPSNLQGVNPEQTDYIYLTWDAPVDPVTGTIPPGLLGFNIYRDGALVGTTEFSVTVYFDLNLEWLPYIYNVSAIYDLTYYGLPGETGESAWAGPIEVIICCIPILPFNEYFHTGSLATNQWEVDDESWHILGQMGNPAPAVEFNSAAGLTNYSTSLTSYWQNNDKPGANLHLQYDLRLDDNFATGTEKLVIEYNVFRTTEWVVLGIDSATGDRDWGTYELSFDSDAEEHYFRFRFRAIGQNSENINYWQIDNIVIDRAVSVKKIEIGEVSIYPNPAGSNVTITVEKEVNLMSVYNQSGFPVASYKFEPSNHTLTLDVSHFKNGLYYLRFSTDLGNSIGKKLVVFK